MQGHNVVDTSHVRKVLLMSGQSLHLCVLMPNKRCLGLLAVVPR